MTHDVFISHASLDKPAADAVCHGLEAKGIRCWMAPRDQIAGKPYGQQITEAIHGAHVMVLIFSEHVNNSQAVLNEINLAAAANLTIVPFRIASVPFNPELNYYLGRTHWLDAFPPPLEPHLDALAATVRRNLPEAAAPAAPVSPQPQPGPAPPPQPTPHPQPVPPPRTNYVPWIVGATLFAVVLIVYNGLNRRPPSPAQEQAANTISQAIANAIQSGDKDGSDEGGGSAATIQAADWSTFPALTDAQRQALFQRFGSKVMPPDYSPGPTDPNAPRPPGPARFDWNDVPSAYALQGANPAVFLREELAANYINSVAGSVDATERGDCDAALSHLIDEAVGSDELTRAAAQDGLRQTRVHSCADAPPPIDQTNGPPPPQTARGPLRRMLDAVHPPKWVHGRPGGGQ